MMYFDIVDIAACKPCVSCGKRAGVVIVFRRIDSGTLYVKDAEIPKNVDITETRLYLCTPCRYELKVRA